MNTTEQERLLIVKINHLAERLEPYSDRPRQFTLPGCTKQLTVSCTAAMPKP